MTANQLPEHEELPSGKSIHRQFDNDGSLTMEMHNYGCIEIGITLRFHAGIKIEETYFLKDNLVSRRSYEKARARYKDMPPADNGIEDWAPALLSKMGEERRKHQAEADNHIPDPERAKDSNAFCTDRMNDGKCCEVREWIKIKGHTLGEMDAGASKNLVKRLYLLGSVSVYACEIDDYEDGHENTGHLVIELPKACLERKNILKKIDSLAREQGYEGPHDDGQRYAYVKLD